jgi:putative aldouronate transport system substrate-binding protein
MKRKLSLICAVLLLATMLIQPLAGIASSSGTVTFPLAEPYTVKAFAYSTPGEELSNSLFMKEMEKRTNVKWELSLASEAEIVEKLGLSFNSGEYYDVYIKSGISMIDANKFAQQGIIIPLNTLIDQYMPNLKKLLDERNLWKDITSGDGSIYALPQINDPGVAAPSVFINGVWLDAVGKNFPATVDEYLDVLRAFRDNDPNKNGEKDEFPLYLPAGGVDIMMPYFGIAMDWNTMSMYNIPGSEITYVPTSDQFRNFLNIMHTMYDEKLINQDCFTASWDELNAMGATKDVLGGFPSWGAYLHVGSEKDENYPMLMPLMGKTFPVSNGLFYGGLVITDKCTKPEVIAAWADYLYTEEGGRLAWMGVEGETYTIDEKGTYHWNTDGKYGTDITSIRNTQGLFGNKPVPVKSPLLFNEGQANLEELFLYKEREKIKAYGADYFPALSWTDDEIKEKSTLLASINPYFQQYEAKVITGELDLNTSWDEYLQTMDNMGLARLKEIDKAAFDRWLAEYASK